MAAAAAKAGSFRRVSRCFIILRIKLVIIKLSLLITWSEKVGAAPGYIGGGGV